MVFAVAVTLLACSKPVSNDGEDQQTTIVQDDNQTQPTTKRQLAKDIRNDSRNKNHWTFRKYCDKYDSIRVIRKVEKKVRDGRIKKDDVLTEVFKGVDPTEDLLALKIKPVKSNAPLNPISRRNTNGSQRYPKGIQLSLNGTLLYPNGAELYPNGAELYPNGSELYSNDTRRFPAFGPEVHKEYLLPYDTTKTNGGFDPFYIRARLMELMKQAIYNVRIKMVPMQIIRSKFLDNSLYKMGFLISKTDNKCKVYSKVAWLAWRACMNFRQDAGGGKQHTILDMLPTEERLLHLRFEIDLLVDLVMANERQALRVIAKYRDHRLEKFKFQD